MCTGKRIKAISNYNLAKFKVYLAFFHSMFAIKRITFEQLNSVLEDTHF